MWIETVPREGMETDAQLRRRGLLSRKIEDVQLPEPEEDEPSE